MRRLTADWILTEAGWLNGHSLVLGEAGDIAAIEASLPGDEHLPGWIVPGLVNAHCHLELSHLQGRLPEQTGMAGFIRQLQGIRAEADEASREAAALQALQAQWDLGVRGLGDICNGEASFPAKAAFPELDHFNFIELFGGNPGQAEEIFFRGLEQLRGKGHRTSFTLHAPYSISVLLRDKVAGYANRRGWRQSVHMLESAEERQLFAQLEGPLLDMLRDFGLGFQAHTYASPLEFILEAYAPEVPLLLVHCTEMTADEIAQVAATRPQTWFVLCPAANRYIHGTLPPAAELAAYPDRVCLGTDSLAGNHSLNLWEDMVLLQQAYGLDSALLLRWATRNGAAALGFKEERYTIRPGARPALLHVKAGSPEQIPTRPLIQEIEHL